MEETGLCPLSMLRRNELLPGTMPLKFRRSDSSCLYLGTGSWVEEWTEICLHSKAMGPASAGDLGRVPNLKTGFPGVRHLQPETFLSPHPGCRLSMKMEQFLKTTSLSSSSHSIFGSQDVTGCLSAHLLPPCCLAADHTGGNACLDVRVQHKSQCQTQTIPCLDPYG